VESPLTRLASLAVVGALGALGLAATGQPAASAGVKVADVVAIMGSVDPVFGEVDR